MKIATFQRSPPESLGRSLPHCRKDSLSQFGERVERMPLSLNLGI